MRSISNMGGLFSETCYCKVKSLEFLDPCSEMVRDKVNSVINFIFINTFTMKLYKIKNIDFQIKDC